MTWSREKIEETLAEFLKIESQPQSDKGAIINAVMPFLEEMGLDIRIYDNGGNPAIFAASPEPKILLSGHLDTVAVDPGAEHQPGHIEGDRMYGRGSLDMKGPCAAMLSAAEDILARGHGVALAFTTDEEVGMQGAKVLANENPQIADIPLIVICEPTAMVPVTEEKGLLQLKIKTGGVSAHASMPETGVSALHSIISGLAELLESRPFGKLDSDPVSLNIGTLEGGTLINMIASGAEARVDMRFSPDFSKEGLRARVTEIMEASRGKADLEIEELHDLPPVRSRLPPEVLSTLEEWLAPAGKVPYATEMAVFGLMNPRILVLGPGQVDLAHTQNEWISIPELLRAAELWSRIPDILPDSR